MSNQLEIVFERVSAWNKARYPREYNKNLAVALLSEELEEYFEASEHIPRESQEAEMHTGLTNFHRAVERLDALCDTIYVAMGVIWKLGVNDRERSAHWMKAVEFASGLMNGKVKMPPVAYATGVMSTHKKEVMYNVTIDMQMIIVLCLAQMQTLGLNEAELIEALLIVCDSNDSKSVKKTDPSVKANIDKGETFIAPEFRLQTIIDKVAQRAS
jgi:hypothetical protein